MPALSCTLSAPLETVQSLFRNAGSPASSESAFGVPEHFRRALAEPAVAEKIPVLGRPGQCSPPEGSLVRFRGMVVDMEDPEYYFGAVRYRDGSWATTKYGGASALRADEEPVDTKVWERRPLHCVPVPGEASWAPHASNPTEECTVYVYDQDGQNVLLHSIVDVIGVYTTPPPPSVGANDEDGQDPKHAPRTTHQVHAILLESQTEPGTSPEQQQQQHELLSSSARLLRAREAALKVLQHVLGGDSLGAETLLLSLLSQASTRVPGQPPTSAAPMNIILPPESPMTSAAAAPAPAQSSGAQPLRPSCYGSALHTALGALAPLCSYLPLSVQQCNASTWAPKRDYDNNRLSRSPLQLSNGTVLLVDETPMGEGRLSEAGLASFEALNTLVQQQALLYDFHFYKQPVPVSVTPIVLSKGRSVMHEGLPLRLHLKPAQPLPTTDEVAAAIAALDSQALQDIRTYLVAAKQQPYALSDDMVKQLQEEFVAARKDDRSFSPERFHARLTVARLAALSFGECDLSMERWQYVLGLEEQLESRAARRQ